ncbi:MAG TPA: 50S ribosomal protein L10 [Candidatus Nanoarchaeia archaeon]|nr:50S ribosomal protein L10 [Candidatus Nanoarchaeia archaeon]
MVSQQKKQLVQQLIKDIDQYPIVGVLNLQNLPAQQLQAMRAMLKQKGVKLSMTKKKLLELALDQSKKENLQQLKQKIKGMPALLFTKDNPFALNVLIERNKSEAPAKAGQTAPRDIVVKAGPTSFAPGPIISELAAVGIKTKVNAGKLEVIQDTTVAKEGDIISPKVAETLKRLDIKPMEVGLNLVAVWEEGLVFDAKQLHIDEKEFVQNVTQAASWAMNLAVEAAYLTTETTEILLQKAFREAKVVGVEYAIMNKETSDEILARSERQALSLKREANL